MLLLQNYLAVQSDGTVQVTWSVDDPYDFERGPKITYLPLPTHQTLKVPHRLSEAMATQMRIAQVFNMHSEWETTISSPTS